MIPSRWKSRAAHAYSPARLPHHCSRGRNLQAFQHQIFAQWPRSALLAEQTLGRTHRNGQKADELAVHTLMSIEFDHVCRAACLKVSPT